MKNSKNAFAYALPLLAAMATSTSLAQVNTYTEGGPGQSCYNPSAYVAPSISYMQPNGDFRTGKRATGFGLRFGKPVSPHWDMQIGLSLARTSDSTNRYEQASLGIDALYMFSRSNFRTLLLVGVGAEKDKLTKPSGSTSTASSFVGLGTGVQLAFNDQWGMQTDIRRNHAFSRGNNLGLQYANTDVVSVALTYAFKKVLTMAARAASQAAPAPAHVAPAPVAQAPPAPVAQAVAPPPLPTLTTLPTLPPTARFKHITMSASKLFNFDSATLRTLVPKLQKLQKLISNFDIKISNV